MEFLYPESVQGRTREIKNCGRVFEILSSTTKVAGKQPALAPLPSNPPPAFRKEETIPSLLAKKAPRSSQQVDEEEIFEKEVLEEEEDDFEDYLMQQSAETIHTYYDLG